MDEFNIYGWSAIHEASYKGYANSILRFINYARDEQKNLIELKTIDELRATPLLIATLGGSLDCIQLLVESGSNLNETIEYKKSKHGLIEIATIRNDINVLSYLFDKIDKFGDRVRKLMMSDENDDDIRSSLGRCLEILTNSNRDDVKKALRDDLVEKGDFGKCLAVYLRLGLNSNETILSAILILLNQINNSKVRMDFIKNMGIDLLVTCLIIEQTKFIKVVEKLNDAQHEDLVEEENYSVTAALGQILAELTNFDECLRHLNSSNQSQKIIRFFHLLFQLDAVRKAYSSRIKGCTIQIRLDEFIACFIDTIGNLTYENVLNKQVFRECNLFEILLNTWKSLSAPVFDKELASVIRLAVINCFGKVLCENSHLKDEYIMRGHEETHAFIKEIYENLDPNRSITKEIRVASIVFLTRISYADRNLLKALISFDDIFNSRLLLLIKDLIKKSPIPLKEDAFKMLWTLTGAENYYESQNDKWLIYKVIGTRNFVDSLCDSEAITLISLEALRCISTGACYRDHKTNALIEGSDDMARVHAIPATIRLLRSSNELILLSLLKTIASFCLTSGFVNSKKNQSSFVQLGLLPSLVEFCTRKSAQDRKLKFQAFYCLSCVCFNNISIRNVTYKYFPGGSSSLISTLLIMLMGADTYLDENDVERKFSSSKTFHELKNNIIAGQCICLFAYRNDEFQHTLVSNFGKIPLRIFTNLLERLNKEGKTLKNSIDIAKAKCLLVTQIALLYKIIDSSKVKEDPRAFVIQILIDQLTNSQVSYVRALAIDCFCRIIRFDKIQVEALADVGLVEQLCYSLVNKKSSKLEMSNASLTLALLSDASSEVRRRLMRFSRVSPSVMHQIKYYNRKLNEDLNSQWSHHKNIMSMLKKEQPFKNKSRKLPPIIKLPKLKL